MKRIMLLSVLSLILVGCSTKTDIIQDDNSLIVFGIMNEDYNLVKDSNTGCFYIQENSKNSKALTPYYDEVGEVYGV